MDDNIILEFAEIFKAQNREMQMYIMGMLQAFQIIQSLEEKKN